MTDDKPLQRRLFRFSMAVLLNIQGNLPAQRAKSANMVGQLPEVRDILASLEIVYRQLFPHLNLRQWSGFIYQWLTQSPFDPTHSGRVTMDHVMKLVTTALERTYEDRKSTRLNSSHS